MFEDQCRSYSDGNLVGQKDCKQREDPGSSPPHIGEVCLSLLTRLIAYTPTANGASSSEVRMWLSSESCSSSVESLLPLVFHPCPSMRREIAVLLAFMLFSSDVLISSLEEVKPNSLPSFCLLCHSYSWVIHWHQVAFLKLCVGWLAAVGNQQRQTIEVEFHNIVSGHISSISKRPKVFMWLWALCAIAIFALASLPMQGGWCQIVPLW